MKQTITVIGGDRRFLYACGYFERCGFQTGGLFNEIEREASTVANTVLLPVPAVKNGFLNAPYSKEKISADRLLGLLPEGSRVFAGMPDGKFYSAASKRGFALTDYYKDEALLNENAVLTAKALVNLLREMKIKIGDGKTLVLGYGRCGKATADALRGVGGNVTVLARRGNFDGERLVCLDMLEKMIEKANLVINTVPSPVLDEKTLLKAGKEALFVEIASAPFGIDFACAERLGLKVVKAPGLPGKYFPKEAGEAIARTVIQYLRR